jgi:molybdate transport system substrate-binding protein
VSSTWSERLGAARAAAFAVVAAIIVVVWLRSPRVDQVPVVRIAAASDLRFALDELTDTYSRTVTKASVQVTYGSSGTLYSQILNGAPFDLFLSADTTYPRQLEEKGKTIAGSEFTYGIGRLVVWVPASSTLDVTNAGINVVSDPRVTHVAIANPAHAPYGRAAEAAMQRAQAYDLARPKLVLGENVSQAMQFAQSGAADVAIVALSLAVAPTAKGTGRYSTVPVDLYPPIEQAGVVLTSRSADAALQFRSYLLGEAARDVLARYGFSRPTK